MDLSTLGSAIAAKWDDDIVPQLVDYIRIPAKSPHFDPDWQVNGHIERAIKLAQAWVTRQPVHNLAVEIVRLPGRTPVLFFDVAGSSPGERTVLLYGHLDKQPEMVGWRDGCGPWDPILEDGKLYGRGGADDGYAVFAALSAIGALQAQGIAHARCVGIIETCEESGSFDLPAYLDALAPRMGRVDFVVGLDSGCGDYERLWATTSLRGLAGGVLTVEVLTEGVHSGDASGVFPFADATQPMASDRVEAVLNRTWRPALSTTGADGMPAIADAGNVLRPRTALKLSLRLPPTVDADAASRVMKEVLEADPPYRATVRFDVESASTGWNARPTAEWLARALDDASSRIYGKPSAATGEGGTIPFMAMLGKHFPDAQFLITGVLGPHSNAHGPNEFLHVPYASKLTACVAMAIAAHAQASR